MQISALFEYFQKASFASPFLEVMKWIGGSGVVEPLFSHFDSSQISDYLTERKGWRKSAS